MALPGAQRSGYNKAVLMPDGKRLLTSSEEGLVLWELPPPGQRLAVDGHQGPVHGIAIRRDGTLLASGGADKLVRLWDLANGRLRRSLPGHFKPVQQVRLSPDGTLLASADADGIRLWDVEAYKEVYFFKEEGKSERAPAFAFSRDGQYLAAGQASGAVRLYEVAGRKLLRTLTGHRGGIRAVAFGRGPMLASGGADGIRLWNTDNGDLIHYLKDHEKTVTALAFRRDGRVLASGADDQTVRLWDVDGGRLDATLRGHTAPVHALAFRPGGKLLASAAADGTVRLWDLSLDPPEDNPLRLVSADPRVWPDGRPIHDLAFTPDGHFLATANLDGTVYVLRLSAPAAAE